MLAEGATPGYASANAGVWTYTIRGGHARVRQPSGVICEMRFTFAGAQVSVDSSANGNENCDGQVRGTYVRRGRTVRFDWTADIEGARFASWTRGFFRRGMHLVGNA
jgi:hypothetical protein